MNNQTENPKEEQVENPKEEQPLKPKKVWIEPELKLLDVNTGRDPAPVETSTGFDLNS